MATHDEEVEDRMPRDKRFGWEEGDIRVLTPEEVALIPPAPKEKE